MLDDRDLARALKRLRELSSLSERRAARMIGVPTKTLKAWEEHRLLPTREHLARAVEVYGYDVRMLIVPRQSIVRPEEPNVMFVGTERIDLAAIRRYTPARSEYNRKVLARYLEAVRSVRGSDETVLQLRPADLFDLSQALELSDAELGDLLSEAFDLTPAGTRATSRALLAAAILAVSVLGTVGGPWFTPEVAANPNPVHEVALSPDAPQPAATGPSSTAPLFSTTPAWMEQALAEQPARGHIPLDAHVFSVSPRVGDSAVDTPKALPRAADLASTPRGELAQPTSEEG